MKCVNIVNELMRVEKVKGVLLMNLNKLCYAPSSSNKFDKTLLSTFVQGIKPAIFA